MNNTTELCDLFLKYKADKCPAIAHSYSPKYYEILKNLKNDPINLLEIAVGSLRAMQKYIGNDYQVGASLRAWRDFFTNGQIFGLDIDSSALFECDRIKCFLADQGCSNSLEISISNIKEYTKNSNLSFDIIIDDGSHLRDHMIISFQTLFKYLKPNGFYIIEDIKNRYMRTISNLNAMEKFAIPHTIHYGNYKMDNFVVYKKI